MAINKKSILVVDDELCIVHSLSYMFREAGYDCFTAINVEEVEEILKKERPELIILDVNMPGKNGYQICRDIRKRPDLKDVYIIMLSAMGQEVDTEQGMQAGANEYLTKPFDPVLLRKKTRDILKHRE